VVSRGDWDAVHQDVEQMRVGVLREVRTQCEQPRERRESPRLAAQQLCVGHAQLDGSRVDRFQAWRTSERAKERERTRKRVRV